jgi:hypothetical protein
VRPNPFGYPTEAQKHADRLSQESLQPRWSYREAKARIDSGMNSRAGTSPGLSVNSC